MSTAATAAVMRAAGALPPGPALVFDLGIVRDRMDRARAAARAAGVELLHAVKAFPAPVAVELAATHLDGLDVAGPEEQAAALAVAPTTVSVTWPGDVDAAALTALAARHRVTAVCETAAQLATAAKVAGVTLAVRLASDADSRFGVAPEALREVVAVAAGRVRALHVHGGPLATSPGTIAARARRACDAADAAGLALAQLDLGGSLHGFAITSATSGQALVADAFAAARAVVPTGVRLLFEPGRLWTEGAGFAVGRVLAARRAGERELRVLELSRLCHLRWSTPRLVAPPPRPPGGRRGGAGETGARPNHARVAVTLLGATCCEDDVIGDAVVPPEHLAALDVGARVVLSGVTGYAVGWNRAFAGVPAAQVVTVASD